MQKFRLVVHRLDRHAEFKALGARLLVRCRHDHIGLASRIRNRVDFKNALVRNFNLELAILALCRIGQRVSFRILEPRSHSSLRVLDRSRRREVFSHSRIESRGLYDNRREHVAFFNRNRHNNRLGLRFVDNAVVTKVILTFEIFGRRVLEATVLIEGKRSMSRLLGKFSRHALRYTFGVLVISKDAFLGTHRKRAILECRVFISSSLSQILRRNKLDIDVHTRSIDTIRCKDEDGI